MYIVNLKGGMGNQMFQYALGRSLSILYNSHFKLDLTFLLDRSSYNTHVFRDYDLDIFKLQADIATQEESFKLIRSQQNFLQKTFPRYFRGRENKYTEKYFHFDAEVLRQTRDCYFDGYWQSQLYFRHCEDLIRKDFVFRNELPDKHRSLQQKINVANSICINIRRTDFLNTSFHGVCNKDYFERGIRNIIERAELNEISIYVFADDLDWCRENLNFKYPTYFIDHDFAGDKFQYYLQLMTSFRYYVIPNSTFAWWAAFLSAENGKKIVAPANWFADNAINTNDLIPSDWIRL
jgi:hypothetical protein